MTNAQLSKIIALVGPTASGKTRLGVTLAKQFNGEVVSADSRAIYQEMNIGTAKPSTEEQAGIPHHLIDFVPLDKNYTVAHSKKDALAVINTILSRGKLPILVGGTGLYIKAVIDNLEWPKIPANPALRRKLEAKPPAELFATLQALDPETAAIIDEHNPRRLVRALEVRLLTGKSFQAQQKVGPPLFETLQVGLNPPKEELYKRIDERLAEQIERGLENEVRGLVAKYGWDSILSSTIKYQEWRPYFENQATLAQTIAALKKADRDYAKRQLTWFKKDQRVKWVKSDDEALKVVAEFLSVSS